MDINDISEIPEPTIEQLRLVQYGYRLRHVYWPDYTFDSQRSCLKVLKTKKNKIESLGLEEDKLRKRLSAIFDKLNASFYHLERIKENEQLLVDFVKKFATESKSKIPDGVLAMFGGRYEPINHEYESFLISLKSALDILSISISQACGFNVDNITQLDNHLKSQSKKKTSDFSLKLKKLFDKKKNVKIIEEFKNGESISKRNYAVHHGSLGAGSVSIQFTSNSPNKKKPKAIILEIDENGKLIKVRELLKDCEEIFYDSCDLFVDILEILLEQKLQKGKKTSVYLERDLKK
ncbi:MAG: hypothetical protein ABI425_04080 [Patescibacteria group bacterium]